MIMKDDSTDRQFDWEDVKNRLSVAQKSLSAADDLNKDQIKSLMAERARRIAQAPEVCLDTSEMLEVVRFRIGREEFAIATQFALALREPKCITPIPDTEDYFLGVTNLQGEITTVIDLGRFLGIPCETKRAPQVLVLGTSKPECAIVVDGLEHVMTLRKQDILEPAGGLGSIVDLLIGCTSEALMILDGDALLKCNELYIDQSEQ